jgi:hypothetical protein
MDSDPDALRQLVAPIEQILTCGGDTRLVLDPVTRLNGYGCRPFPRPEAFTFASSTATSISERAYAAAAGARQALLRDSMTGGFARAFAAQMAGIRAQILRLLALEGSGCEIVLSPSGTDSQLHALFVARALMGTPLASVIAAADETGSGTPFAATGRHFNAATAQGAAVAKGEAIAGLSEEVEGLAVPARDARGALRADRALDEAVAAAVANLRAERKRVLLFAMDSSKLGLRAPSLDYLRMLAAAPDGNVQVVIDACQARLGRRRLRWYLDQGFMVLITGSKFFTGAPFSGALLLPPALAARCAALDRVPEGLRDYTNRYEWPDAFAGLRAALPGRANLGAWLRWVSALEEMRAYYAVPASFRELALAQFAETVPRLIAAAPCLELLAFDAAPESDGADEELGGRTIFPFFVKRNGRALSQAETAMLYRALNEDVAPLLPAQVPPMQRLLGARRCHIGQPVALPDGQGGVRGALRISAGARIVSETWCEDLGIARENLRREFDQVRAIVEKLHLLVRHYDEIAAAETPSRRPNPRVSAA